jgi:hypothetical protein
MSKWEGKQQLVLYCSTKGNPDNWFLDNKESRGGLWAAYKISWQTWPMVKQGYLLCWGLGHNSNEGREVGNSLWDPQESCRLGKRSFSWCSASALGGTLRIVSLVIERVKEVHGMPISLFGSHGLWLVRSPSGILMVQKFLNIYRSRCSITFTEKKNFISTDSNLEPNSTLPIQILPLWVDY